MRGRARTVLTAAVAAIGLSVAGGCSGSDDPVDPVRPEDSVDPAEMVDATTPALGRIDGPATVDPSYDPFAVPDGTAGG